MISHIHCRRRVMLFGCVCLQYGETYGLNGGADYDLHKQKLHSSVNSYFKSNMNGDMSWVRTSLYSAWKGGWTLYQSIKPMIANLWFSADSKNSFGFFIYPCWSFTRAQADQVYLFYFTWAMVSISCHSVLF